MAWRKIIRYLFIPVFAILLMSHNTYAFELNQAVEFKQTWTNNRMVCATRFGSNITFSSNTCVLNGSGSTGLIGSGLSYIYTADVNLVQGDYYEFLLQVGVSGGAQTDIPVVWNMATTNNFSLVSFEKVSTDENLGSSATSEAYVSFYRVILRSSVNNSSYPLELGYSNHQTNMFYIAGDTGSLTVDFRISSINRYSPKSDDQQSVVDAINNQTENEENSASDIQNQSTSDIDTGDTSSALSIIGNIQNITGIIQDAPLKENCIINANFGNLNLGGLNLCSGRENLASVADFGNAVFALTTTLAGSIYLIRKTLKLIDWARGD